MNPLKSKGKRFILIVNTLGGEISPTKARLDESGQITSNKKYPGKSWTFSRDALRGYPTVWNKLGFSRGLFPAHVVYEEVASPVVFQNHTYRFESSMALHAFKKGEIVKNFNMSAKEANGMNPHIKYMLIGGCVVVGLILLAFLATIYMLTGGDLNVLGSLQGRK